MKEKIIAKLKEIKFQLKPLNNSYYVFENKTLNSLIDRTVALIKEQFGDNSNYIKRLDDIKKDVLVLVRESHLECFKNLIDEIIDLIEITAVKEERKINQRIVLPNQLEFKKETKTKNSNIFIVHGHNEAMRLAVARMLEKLELKPIILHEQTNKGSTIIEKFIANSDVGFAVVLLSADDKGYSIKEGSKKAKKRARQNVIFELGYFIAKLGRNKVVALVDGTCDFELPSDYHGIIYITYDGDNGKWKNEVIKELKGCGYTIDANKII